MIHWVLFMNAQGKTRLDKWYTPHTQKERERIKKDMLTRVIKRPPKSCNFVQWKEFVLVYRRYASLYAILCCDPSDNQLLVMEIIQFIVECLDQHFGNVCELDLIFCFDQAYYILDECIMAGEMQESSKREIKKAIREATVDLEEEDDHDAEDLFGIFG